MTAHERLMQTLYGAIRDGGSGMTRTQLMRLALPTIEALRGTRSSWRWIAARIEHVHLNGVEMPAPSESVIEACFSTSSLGPVRSAYSRLAREEKEKPVAMVEGNGKKTVTATTTATTDRAGDMARASLPAIRAGPKPEPASRPNAGVTLAEASQNLDTTPRTFFANRQKLSKLST